MQQNVDRTVAIDSHAHFYDCFDTESFLDAALRNLLAPSQDGTSVELGVLLLADTTSISSIDRLRDRLTGGACSWTFMPTAESNSLLLYRGDELKLAAVSGRQCSTSDGLEILAFDDRQCPTEVETVRDALSNIVSRGGLPILPWGLGKWWLRRRSIILELFQLRLANPWFVGDLFGRPHAHLDAEVFQVAQAAGIPTLSGSDPLSWRSQALQVGKLHNRFTMQLDIKYPAKSIFTAMRQLQSSPNVYGKRMPWPELLANQMRLRLNKRVGIKS